MFSQQAIVIIIVAVVLVLALALGAMALARPRVKTGKEEPISKVEPRSAPSAQPPVAQAPVAPPAIRPPVAQAPVAPPVVQPPAAAPAEEIQNRVRAKVAKYSDLRRVKLDFAPSPDGSMQVWVDKNKFDSIDQIPDQRLRDAIEEALDEWTKTGGSNA